MNSNNAGNIGNAGNEFEKRMIRVHKKLEGIGFQVEREDYLYGKSGGSSYFTIALCSEIEEEPGRPFDCICGQCEEWRLIRVSDHDPKHNVRLSEPDGFVEVLFNNKTEEIVGWILEALN